MIVAGARDKPSIRGAPCDAVDQTPVPLEHLEKFPRRSLPNVHVTVLTAPEHKRLSRSAKTGPQDKSSLRVANVTVNEFLRGQIPHVDFRRVITESRYVNDHMVVVIRQEEGRKLLRFLDALAPPLLQILRPVLVVDFNDQNLLVRIGNNELLAVGGQRQIIDPSGPPHAPLLIVTLDVHHVHHLVKTSRHKSLSIGKPRARGHAVGMDEEITQHRSARRIPHSYRIPRATRKKLPVVWGPRQERY
mmetsp:Transcript_3831/g.10570  ORF Transcript_3831/g.10570 Transcript_3831/m.10570 type:complete len:246 (-) Transcript_3831:249-986(-)